MLLTACTYQPFTYGFPGPHTTRQYFDAFDFHGHSVEFTVYYPELDPLTACPLVIFSAGWNQPRTTNEALCIQLAQWGFVVVNRQYPSLLDSLFQDHIEHTISVLDWALAENDRTESPLYRRIDPDNLATAGYSMGAGIAVAAAAEDPRFKACVAIDALGGDAAAQLSGRLGSLEAATLYIQSTVDGRIGDQADLLDLTPPPAMQVDILGATHMQFEDRIVGLNQLGPIFAFPDGPADAAQTRAIATRYTVAWLKIFLEGDTTFLTYLTGPHAQADIANNLVTIRSRQNSS
jgi:hypothetical protein